MAKSDLKDAARDAIVVGSTAIGISEAANFFSKVSSSTLQTTIYLGFTVLMSGVAIHSNNALIALAVGVQLLTLLLVSPLTLLVLFLVYVYSVISSDLTYLHFLGIGLLVICIENIKSYLGKDVIRASLLSSSQLAAMVAVFNWDQLKDLF